MSNYLLKNNLYSSFHNFLKLGKYLDKCTCTIIHFPFSELESLLIFFPYNITVSVTNLKRETKYKYVSIILHYYYHHNYII